MEYQNMLWLLAILLVLAGTIPLICYGMIAWNKHLLKVGKHPVLRQFLHEAIVLAYKSSDAVFDMVEERLHSVEKREIAAQIYDLLPDGIEIKIFIFPLKLEWKKYVSKEQFMDFLSTEYDKLCESFRIVRETILKELLESMEARKNLKVYKS